MEHYGIDEHLRNTIKWLYNQTKFQVGHKVIDLGSGVVQGGVLSPTNFLIAFSELLERLKEEGFDVAAYADDLVITGNGMKNLLIAMGVIEEWKGKAKM